MARIEELTREATALPTAQRLALARALLDLETTGGVAETEMAWDEEIRERIRAVDEGRASGVAYADLQREMNARSSE